MSIDKVLNPSSVAIIGASRNRTKRGFQAIRTMLEDKYEGRIFPVNPKETSILGLKCYPSITEIDEPVDLALITTPARSIPAVLEECGRKEVAGAVIIAGGFAETGQEGKKLEAQMTDVARRHNIRLIGPNTSGMMNLISNLNLVGIRDAPKGDIALLTQSGNMALSLITEARIKSRKGFSYYVGVGNEADINFHEYLEFFRDNPDTRAILMYVEGMHDGRRFLQEAYKTTIKKPIILLKSGRTSTGKRAAGSHTGSLAGMSEVFTGAFRRAGITVVENSDELFPVAETLSSLPPIKNNKVAILADGGGHATIAADLLTEYGVEIPQLNEKTQAQLRRILPGNATVANPIDVAGATDSDPELFADVVEVLLKDKDVGGLLMVGLFGGYGIRFDESLAFPEEDAAHRMGKLVAGKKKPIIVHSLYSFERPHALDLLRYYNVPVFDSVDIAAKCMGTLAEYGQYLDTYHSKVNFVLECGKKANKNCLDIIGRARKEGRNALLEHEVKAIFREHGIKSGTESLAASAAEAVKIAKNLGAPVAMKIVSPDILHKSDAGGVVLNLSKQDEIKRAFSEIMANAKKYNEEADIRGVLVTPMVEKGLETIIGTKIDEVFGPIIMFGIGGVLVEVLKDVSFRVLPIKPFSAKSMIEDIRSSRLLDGYRGSQSYDKKALKRLLLTVSEVMEAYPAILEMDLNPVILHGEGLSIADARIILTPPDEDEDGQANRCYV